MRETSDIQINHNNCLGHMLRDMSEIMKKWMKKKGKKTFARRTKGWRKV